MTAHAPPPTPPPESTDAPTIPDANTCSSDPRLKRIAEQLAEALRDPDLLRGNLSARNCELMDLGCRLKLAIDEGLANDGPLLDQFAELSPALDVFLRMMKQIERFAQLDARLAAARRAADPASNSPRAGGAKPAPPSLSGLFGF